MKIYRFGLFSLALFPQFCFSQSVQDFDPSREHLQAIAADWNRRVRGISDALIEEFEEPVFMRLDPSTAKAGKEELAGAIQSFAGWEALSDRVLSTVSRSCGQEVLNAVSSSFSSGDPVDDSVRKEYSLCYSSAFGNLEAGAWMSLMQDPGIATVLGKYEPMLASYQRISTSLTTASVEGRYGRTFDDIIQLHSVVDDSTRDARSLDLERRLESERAIWLVQLQDPDENGSVYGSVFSYRQPGLPSSSGSSCSGSAPPEQEGMIRCTWKGEGFGNDNVIKYTRKFTHGSEQLSLVVHFDYAALLAAVAQ